MNKHLLILGVLGVFGCTKPTPPPKVMEFQVNGLTLTIKGKLKDKAKFSAEDAKKEFNKAVKILDAQ